MDDKMACQDIWLGMDSSPSYYLDLARKVTPPEFHGLYIQNTTVSMGCAGQMDTASCKWFWVLRHKLWLVRTFQMPQDVQQPVGIHHNFLDNFLDQLHLMTSCLMLSDITQCIHFTKGRWCSLVLSCKLGFFFAFLLHNLSFTEGAKNGVHTFIFHFYHP